MNTEVDHAWLPLQSAARTLADSGEVSAAHTAFVARAATADLSEWTPDGAVRVWALLTGLYRALLERQGWDVDLIPKPNGTPPGPAADDSGHAPPAPPAPDPTLPQVADPVEVRRARDGTVTVHAVPGHPVHDTLRMVPGLRWDGAIPAYALTPTARSAQALRDALTGHDCRVSAAAADTLHAALATPPGPDVTVADDGETITIRFDHTKQREADVKRFPKARWDGPSATWRSPVNRVDAVIKFATKHDLSVDETVYALSETVNAPLRYDGTVDGLRGVPVTELRYVQDHPARGKRKSLADRLKAYGAESVHDILSIIPLRYMDRSNTTKIADIPPGTTTGFLATVTKITPYNRAKRYFRVHVSDGTASVSVTYFNAPWMASKYRVGDEVSVYGKMEEWVRGPQRRRQMANAVMDPIADDTALIVPVYPQSEKTSVSTWDLHACADEAVRRLGTLTDPLPEDMLRRHDLLARQDAYTQVHHPDSVAAAEQARQRLAFDELLRMQLVLGMTRAAITSQDGVTHHPSGELVDAYMGTLGFDLTGDQSRVVDEIIADMARPYPMHRLLQGDVGYGKSLVAFITLLTGVEGGYQGALMAPTEILATQLHTELAEHLSGVIHPDTGMPVTVEFLGGKTRTKTRRRILAGLADGSVNILVGTHALITDEVRFANLGVVVIDEQHRFGVEQRAALKDKGVNGAPDLLVMTATPIPRTGCLTAFGDLAVSTLDTPPPGRTPVDTEWITHDPNLSDPTGQPWSLVREHVAAGRQAYVVASLIEDNETLAAQSAEEAFTELSTGALDGLRVGLVHGKLNRDEREATMAAFKDGDLDVLVSTTVIEVGVNVPNATVMVILDATRFGLAQLHQLRGRVGRASYASFCVLTGRAGSADAVQRMQALEESTDGFYLSEVDLELRGSGSLFGTRQSGQSDLRVADLRRDADMIETCRTEADALTDGDLGLSRRPLLRLEVDNVLPADVREWLTRS